MAPFGQAAEQNTNQSNSPLPDASTRLLDSALPQQPGSPRPPQKEELPKELPPSEMVARFLDNENLIEKTVGLNSPEMFQNLELWAAYDRKTGDFAHAETHLKQASEISNVLNDEKLQALLMADYSDLHVAEGKPKDQSALAQAKSISERVKAESYFSNSAAAGASPQHMALETGALAISYAKTGEMDKADKLFKISTKLYQDYAPQDPTFSELQQQYAKIKKGLLTVEPTAGLDSQDSDHATALEQAQPKDPATQQPAELGVVSYVLGAETPQTQAAGPTVPGEGTGQGHAVNPDGTNPWNSMEAPAQVPGSDTTGNPDGGGLMAEALAQMAAHNQDTPPTQPTDQTGGASSNSIAPPATGDGSVPSNGDQPPLTDTKNDSHDDYEREQNLMRNLSIACAAFGSASPEVAKVAGALGSLYASRKPPQEQQALSFMNQASQILEHTPGSGDDLAMVLMQKARVLENMGQADQSAEAERQATYHSKSSFVEQELNWWIGSAGMPISPSSILIDSAELADSKGDFSRADLLYRDAIAINENHMYPNAPQNHEVYMRYAQFLKEHGDAAGAAQYEARYQAAIQK